MALERATIGPDENGNTLVVIDRGDGNAIVQLKWATWTIEAGEASFILARDGLGACALATWLAQYTGLVEVT